jgi:hypothetical protein
MLQALRPNSQRVRVSVGKSIPAPVEGWDAVSPLAQMDPKRAIVLDNWFPQPGYIEVRNGAQSRSTSGDTDPVETLVAYNGLTTSSNRLFAIAGGVVFDASASGAMSATGVTGLATSRWQYVNYTTSAGTHYIWMCSGSDDPKTYNGSVWATPSVTGVTSADIINVNVFKKRIWGILSGSMDAIYLPLDSVAGAATKFPLGSIMQKGGFLVAMATWTHDSGAGADDYLVFISSRGQTAVYKGVDPASDFDLVGVYDLGAPLGYRCFTKVAGDVALINIDGVLPLSTAIQVDRAAAATTAITQRINNAMNTAARNYGDNFGWELIAYPKGTKAILNVPLSENSSSHQYVMNTLTGAWCRFIGWDANCFAVYEDNLYYGGNNGVVYLADTGSLDGSSTIEADVQTAYNYFGSNGVLKKFGSLQPLITSDSDARPSIGLSTDFKDNASLGTPDTASLAAARYDLAVYDESVYPVTSRTIADWTTVSGVGQCASVHFKARIGESSGSAVVLQLNGFNITMEKGGFI